MKTGYVILPLLCLCMAVAAQDNQKDLHAEDSTDVFYRHLNLNEIMVTGVTGDTKMKHATAPISIVSPQLLRATASKHHRRHCPPAWNQPADNWQQHLETHHPRTGLQSCGGDE